MVMPNYYPASALAPQTASYIASDSPLRAYYMGREERLDDEKRNYLREAGNLASQGNISGAVGAAFRGGDPTTAMNISNWDTGRRIQAITMLREGAQRADTPERWSALVNSVERVFGPEMVGNYRDFNSRPQALTALEQAQLQLAQAHAGLYEAQAATSQRQVENQRMFLNRLYGGSAPSSAATPPPLPMPTAPPVTMPPGVPSGVPGITTTPSSSAPVGLPSTFDVTRSRALDRLSAPQAPPPAAQTAADPTSYIDEMTRGQRDRLAALVMDNKWVEAAKVLNEIEERFNTTTGIARGLQELSGIPGQYGGDRGAFGSAVGTYAGDPAVATNPLGVLGRAAGEAYQNLPLLGTGVSPSEVRRQITASTNALASILKPLIRKPGEGTWTDADQALLNSILGNLNQATGEAAYNRELENVRQRINANFGLQLPPLPECAHDGFNEKRHQTSLERHRKASGSRSTASTTSSATDSGSRNDPRH